MPRDFTLATRHWTVKKQHASSALGSLLFVSSILAPVSIHGAMFFDGDLQSGIALALSQSKSVACFVKGVSFSA